MQRSKLLTFVSIGLLLSNLLLVSYIVANRGKAREEHQRPDGPPDHERGSGVHHGPRNLIIERLHFSDEQVASYDKLIQWHRGEIGKADQRIIELKNQLYESLTAPAADGRKDSLIATIAAAQQDIERIHYKHFEDIRDLCTEQQKPDFEALTREIASLFAPPPHKRP